MRIVMLIAVLLSAACSDSGSSVTHPDSGTDSGGTDVGDSPDLSSTASDQGGAADVGGVDAGPMPDVGTDAGSSPDLGTPDMAPDMAVPIVCDYRAVDGIAVIEAENLPLNEDWSTQTAEAGYSGTGYIRWDGPSFNNDPTHGVMAVDIAIDTPGRYQLQWHVRIGNGTNTTEHNDAWVRFADATDFYGLKGETGAEIRRYPKPRCEDAAFTDAIEADANVDVADCSRGSTLDGWLKVYSSGASDWRWSTFTSDNDASRIMVEFDAPGVYTLELAARADLFLIDRLVLHQEALADADVRDLGLNETTCD